MIIYSTPTCPRCKLLMAAFQKAGIPCEESELNAATISECLCDTGKHTTSAPLVKDGACWFFADDFFDAFGNLKSDWLVTLKGVRPHKEFTGKAENETKVQSCSKIWG